MPEARAPRWLVLATRQIAARPAFAVLQVSALSVGLLALVLLVLLRTDLIDSWRQATPKDAPNRFVINVQPDQAEAFRARLKTDGVARYDWFPMIRGRLIAINGQEVRPDDLPDGRARRLVDREFNLSHSATLPPHNEVSEGRWTDNEAKGLSVEDGLAQTLGLKLGDRLRFDMGGAVTEGKITSLRKVDWSSMRVNFFVMFPTATMVDAPVSYIAAFRAPAQAGFDNGLSRDFPNITSIDVSASIAQIQNVLDQVVRAVEFLFGFTLGGRSRRAVRGGHGDARGAGARVRGDARARRERQAARAGPARRAARRRRAGRRARLAGRGRGRLGARPLRVRVQLERLADRAAARRRDRCAARARGRLVGLA